ncbi:LysR family transcriptional regulator [Litoreibacter meonggei]|uniref:LysR family transcriptional regulator n=1 Tax=Litoreibacter meonggei TaxID=1049199 RepID=A0A497VB93_9RHOB|nr:transcriptional regulator GcvA [Litoreibacter meonggei]RLJ40851.1 LysR family transcriptional regulator [Litoreibacter meonggei]
MNDRLPPLTALRAFEAAARHLSFSRAAAELNVTPAALSFQIKSLEEHLGVPVFRRLNRAVELTEEGALLAPGVSDGFDALQSAWRAVKRRLDSATLTVTAGPAFTAKWLAPRLFSFARENPDIELRFSAGLRLVDFARDDVDVAIRFGQYFDEELYSKTLIDEWVAPMMSPELAGGVTRLADLQKMTLLHQEDINFLKPSVNWAGYFAAAGVPYQEKHGPRFSQADHAIDAALAGGGVVLGRLSLTEAYLRDGRLVMPVMRGLNTSGSYRIICPKGHETRPQVARFIEWVLKEMEGMATAAQGVEFLHQQSHE